MRGEGTSVEEVEQQNQLKRVPPFLHMTRKGLQHTSRLLAMRSRHQPNPFREEKLSHPGKRESSALQPVPCKSILPSPGERDVRGSQEAGALPQKVAMHLLGAQREG